jgi:spore coat protein U-like protein
MKKLLFAAVVSASVFSATIPSATAAGVANFNVTATLTSACKFTSTGTLAFGAVTAFGALVNATPMNIVFECTRGLTGITADFDDDAGATKTTDNTDTANPAGTGLLSNGLYYTISTSGGGTAGAGTPADGSGIGAGGALTFLVNGTIPSQAGTCTTGTCAGGTQARTLTLNY